VTPTFRAFVLAVAIVSVGAGYPRYVKKTLYASNDLRGARAPQIVVDKWLAGGTPKTRGKVVLVDMWATWCSGCRDLIPELNAWNSKFKRDLVVIGISDEPAQTIRDFMKERPMNYHVANDPQQRLAKKVGVEAIPQVLVITPDHVVRWQGFPGDEADPLTTEKLAAIIKESKGGS